MMARNTYIENFSEPLNSALYAKIDIHAGDGNLTIDRLSGNEQELASGTVQYFESQGQPARTLVLKDGVAALTLRGGASKQSWIHLPWAACNGATEWQIQLNPTVPSDITAHSNGGNVKLNLAGMDVARVSADTGGGNVDVVLPDNAVNFSAAAKTGAGSVTIEIGCGITGNNLVNASSGAGNVVVHVPSGVAARIHAASGLGKTIVDPRFIKTENNTYQSADFDTAADRIEITANSGAGNVSVAIK